MHTLCAELGTVKSTSKTVLNPNSMFSKLQFLDFGTCEAIAGSAGVNSQLCAD